MDGSGSARVGTQHALIAELVTEVLAPLPAHRRTVVGLCGPPGSGKSRAAGLLVGALTRAGIETGLAPMDGFHLSNAQLDARGARGRKGAPDTFDVAGFRELLQRVRVRRDETVYAPGFSRRLDDPVAAVHAIERSARVVVTEGNYLLFDAGGWQEIRPLLDLVIYLDVPAETLTPRLVRRHRVGGRARSQARDWVHEVDLPNATAVARTRGRADLVWSPVP
ncbi:nucleoside/nucleotide kinase family protein [Rhodococcus sp. HNM0563]|uniref:nucleoside/nucleotide kinase family protein n=1 Tax=unclassified Rhodococcus (in: high G+C Gram-positive bacteria) TaxID=192944 RepID=UPI00146E129A|nr:MULTISPECIES: nucleoside/nucleotide kinase family protein [unclassified Rhodococcus (in: high G+C Gram-positive bacteria)]MCK0089259.1 nucleoside/nucleotide kinase family protein [Rhodococcus sp. F64268]NLU62787.1 nucleoside/nucleotide kinase family protein [Rhodococcus sp. HNM0563]